MNGLTLYEIAADFAQILDSAFDPETGEALPVFEHHRALFESKSSAVAAYILNMDAGAKALADAESKISVRRKRAEKKAAWMRQYLMDNMARLGITNIDAPDMAFQVVLYPERDESIEIDDGATFPAELCNKPSPPSPSKTLIKAAILAGEPISGARIVRRDRMVIK